MKAESNDMDNKAKDALDKYSNMVYRICFMYLKNKSDAEDACQDVFLKYVQHNKHFESSEHEKAWICKVTFNRCKDILKSYNRRFLSLDSFTEGIRNLHRRDKDLDTNIENVSTLTYESVIDDNTVLDIVLKLPAKYKDVIYLYYYEGYSASQIACIKNCNENTIYSQMSRAKKLLKERLGDDYEY